MLCSTAASRRGARAASFAALFASLALVGCESTNTTEAATNSLPIRIERQVTGWFGNTPSPTPVVENPPVADNQSWPRLGSMPPVPRVAPVEERRAAMSEMMRERDEAVAENARLAALSPFETTARPAGPDAPAPAVAPVALPVAGGRSVATIVFDANSTAFGEAQRQAVRQAAAQLAAGRGRVRVVGFAGAGLAPADAAAVARARAQAVAAELQAAGIAPARLSIEAPGAGSGRQVEIVVDL